MLFRSSLLTTSILFLIETSIFFSAFFLIRLKKIGVYFVYFQAPLRLFINYSSVPLLMELVVVYGNVNVGVILFIETIKLATVFYWHIYSLNRETFKEAIRGYLDFLFKTNTIIASFLLFALLKTLIYSILYSENAPMLYGNIASFFINSILAFFAFKRNTIALSFFCISLFLLNALNLIWLLSNPEKYSFFVFLFMLLDLYFIIGAVTITQQIKQKRIEIIKT